MESNMTVLMRALNLSSNFITWTSTSPDYEGTYAPEAIQSDSAVVVSDTDGTTITKRLPLEADHALAVFCNESTASWADSGAMSSGNFTVANGTPNANQAGIINKSILFTRNSGNADEAIVGPNNPTLASGITSITLMGWIYPTGSPTTFGVLIGKQTNEIYSTTGQTIILGMQQNNTPSAYGNGITQVMSDFIITLNRWHHLACTYDGTTLKVYLDGILAGSNVDTSGLNWGDETAQAYPWWIGNSQQPTTTNRRGFVGYIEDARVITRALSLEEIADVAARVYLLAAI